jgi:hypothetical protein
VPSDLRQPRTARTAGSDRTIPAGADAGLSRPGTKQDRIRELLGREEGATLQELIGATGWLPHTTRAALSRIRSAGQALAKSPRPDGATTYRIERATSQAEAAEPEETGSEAAPSLGAEIGAGRRSRRKASPEGARAGA